MQTDYIGESFMWEKAVGNVRDYLQVINSLSYDEVDILNNQITRLESLKLRGDNSTDLSQYYDTAINAKQMQLILNWEEYDLFERVTEESYTQHKPRYYFRGHYDSSFSLVPSVFRDNYWAHEDYLYHQIIVECPEYFNSSTHLDKLVTMQHYNCPTRLLDITSNPLVALYFACKNFGCEKCNNSAEGEVIVFPVFPGEIAYADSDRALMLSCIPSLSSKEKKLLHDEAYSSLPSNKFGKDTHGRYLSKIVEHFYYEVTTEIPAFTRDIKPLDLLEPLFVQPNKTNSRILKQDGAFIISGLSRKSSEAEIKLNAIKLGSIKVTNQKSVLQELRNYGVHEASLFPEIDKVSNYFKTHL